MHTCNRILTAVLSLLAFAGLAPAADPRWTRLATGRWELYTDAGAKSGTAVLRQLLEMQAVFSQVGYKLPETAPPIRVVLYKDKAGFAPFQSGPLNRGVFQSGSGMDHILLLEGGDDTLRSARHEYVHLALYHATGPLPQWLEEGLAEYFSTLTRKGDQAIAGRAPTGHLNLLAATTWLSAREVLLLRSNSPELNDRDRQVLFYAQSWALFHAIMRAPDAADRLSAFIGLLRAGRPQETAFQEIYGKTPEALYTELRASLPAKAWPEKQAPLGPLPALDTLEPKPIEDLEARLVQADALLAHGDETTSAALYEEAARKYPQQPAAVAALGALAMRRADLPAARRHLEQAIALGDKQASTHFEYAILTRDAHGPEQLVVDELTKTVGLNPGHAEAWYLLGTTLLRQSRTPDAIDCLKRAAAIQPRQFAFWEGLSRAYLQAEQRPEARAAAQRAVECAAGEGQTAMARGLVQEIETKPLPKPPKPGFTADGKPIETTVNGKLASIDCNAPVLLFFLETKPAAGKVPAERMVLAAPEPNKLQLRGGQGGARREFVCGPQTPMPTVAAGYLPRMLPDPPPPPPPAPEPPKPVPPAKPVRGKAPAKAPARAPAKAAAKAAPKAPVKPPEPVPVGDLVWLEFK